MTIPLKLPQYALGARRGAPGGEPSYDPQWRYLALGGALAMPVTPRRRQWRRWRLRAGGALARLGIVLARLG
jgi:hypothetical protein